MLNIVSDAIKYTNDGTTMNITANLTDSNITISVSENGIDIAPHNIIKLFEMAEEITTKVKDRSYIQSSQNGTHALRSCN